MENTFEGDYGFTLTIPSFKTVAFRYYFTDKGKVCTKKKYGDMYDYEQKFVFENGLHIQFKKTDKYRLTFEKHQDGRIHCHGIIYNVSYDYILHAIHGFYDHHVGLSRISQIKKITDIRLLNNVIEWETYINKCIPCQRDLDLYSDYLIGRDDPLDTLDFSQYLFGKLKK